MCVVCRELRPWDPRCALAAATAPAEGGGGGPGEVWSLDRIAEQLLTGYWGSDRPRGHEPGPDRAVSYDLEALAPGARDVARAALAEWSLVTGLRFAERPAWRPAETRLEVGDAPAGAGTAARLAVGEAFEGAVAHAGDRDWIRLRIEAGRRVEIAVEGEEALGAPRALLRDGAGAPYPFAWRVEEGRTAIGVEVRGAPATVLIEVAGRNGARGDYRVTARDADERAAVGIAFADDRRGAFATMRAEDGSIAGAEVNVSADWLARHGAEPGGYGFQTYLHEIGHALGLGHAGNYNGRASFAADALYANDSWQASVMSYFDQGEGGRPGAEPAFVVTPMPADLLAVRSLYGEVSVRPGDTTYGEGSTAGGALDLVAAAGRPMAFAILDTGGHDRLVLRSQTADQRVDLRAEAASDVLGFRGTMTIARGTVIEDAVLGSGDDEAVGNAAANRLSGGRGADRLDGGAGDDRLRGQRGDDRLEGGEGADRLRGGPGADRLDGGPGDDLLSGGSDGDVLLGGDGVDRLRGQRGDDRLDGGEGADRLRGGPGDDAMRGGPGADRFRFAEGFGRDRIEDFRAGGERDRVDLRRLDLAGRFEDLDIRAGEGGALLDLGPAGSLLFAGLLPSDLSADAFML